MNKTTRLLISIALLAGMLWVYSRTNAAPNTSFGVTIVTDSVDANPGNAACADSNGDCSLRAAVMEANAHSGPDTILLPPGTYLLTLSGANENNAMTGDLDLNGTLTISGTNAIVSAATLNDRVFDILTGANVTIAGTTLRDAHSSSDGGGILNAGTVTLTSSTLISNSADFDGGGIFNDGILIMTDSSVTFNVAEFGGGIDNSSAMTLTDSSVNFNRADFAGGIQNRLEGTVLLLNSTVNSNIADFDGGGILNDDDGIFTVIGSSISSNTANDHGGGISVYFGSLLLSDSIVSFNGANSGGGIGNSSLITLTNTNVNLNNANFGGGIDNRFDGIALLTDSTLSDNSANSDGGGILNEDDSMAMLINSTISGNTAGLNGGGIGLYSGTFTMTNSTLSDNGADNDGGGVYIEDGALRAYNVTIAFNRAADDGASGDGGGIKRVTGSVTLRNTILAQNIHKNGATEIDDDCNGTLGQLTYSLLETIAGCTFTNNNTITGADPSLSPLADNGGPTQTRALQLNSPALDAGQPGGCKDHNGNNLTADQRGQPRPLDGDGDGVARCDIGAYERFSILVFLPLVLR